MNEFRGKEQKTLAESQGMGNRSNSHRRIRRDRSGSAKRLIIGAGERPPSSGGSRILASSGPSGSRPPMMKPGQAKEASSEMSKQELIVIIENQKREIKMLQEKVQDLEFDKDGMLDNF